MDCSVGMVCNAAEGQFCLFKQIKQNFPLRYFWGESENAIKIQVYAVLIALIINGCNTKDAGTKKSFENRITAIRLHLMSYVALLGFIKAHTKHGKNITRRLF